MKRFFGTKGKQEIISLSDKAAASLVGYEEYPIESPSTNHRYVDGRWVNVSVTRFFGKQGKITDIVIAPADDSDSYLQNGYEEYPSAPPDDCHCFINGAWFFDLAEYKVRLKAAVKAEALWRAQQSFNPAAFQKVYQQAIADIDAATDQAAVDVVITGIMWP